MECHFHPADYLNPADLLKWSWILGEKKKKKRRNQKFWEVKIEKGKGNNCNSLGFFFCSFLYPTWRTKYWRFCWGKHPSILLVITTKNHWKSMSQFLAISGPKKRERFTLGSIRYSFSECHVLFPAALNIFRL